jgi:hypothetical protein
MQHRFYPATIKTKKGEEKYYWLHMADPNMVFKLDYKNSVFYWTKSTFRKDIIELKSYDDYLIKKKENGVLWGAIIDKIKLSDDFDMRLDMFCIGQFGKNIFINDKIKTTIENNSITGAEIKEAPNVS